MTHIRLQTTLVRLECPEPGIARLTLTDPGSNNALSDAMINALAEARQAIDAMEDLRVLILTGQGRCFSSGGSVDDMLERRGMFSSATPFAAREQNYRTMHRIPALIHDIAIPTIAAVNGPAIGGGCDAALMCDIRIASEHAVFSEAFLRAGLIPGDGGAWFLPRVVGLSHAMEMALTSAMIDAEQACSIGLASRVVPSNELEDEAMSLARRIASQPPYVARMTKRLMRFGAQASLADTLEMSANMQAMALTSEEHAAAVRQLAARLR